MRAFAILLASLCWLPAAPASAETWRNYANDRFGASAEYPDRFSIKADPPANNDGQRFFTADRRATFAVFGFLNALDETPRQMLESRKAAGTTYSLASANAGSFTLSGRRGDRITYQRCLRSGLDKSIFVCVDLEYPADAKQEFDPIVTRVANSLRAGKAW